MQTVIIAEFAFGYTGALIHYGPQFLIMGLIYGVYRRTKERGFLFLLSAHLVGVLIALTTTLSVFYFGRGRLPQVYFDVLRWSAAYGPLLLTLTGWCILAFTKGAKKA